MTVFNVLTRGGPDSALLVPERFSRAAFLFGPFWLARHRVWLGLLIWCACAAGTLAAVRFLRLPVDTLGFFFVILALLIGFEGQTWRRAALERRGFNLADIVSAPTREEGERIFFARWPEAAAAPQSPRPPSGTTLRGGEVLGLFPEAGPQR